MKAAVPLYEFMPYGAPELLESRQRHLSRALILTSAASLAVYALVGGLGHLIGTQPPERRLPTFRLIHDVAPPPLVDPISPAPALPRPARASGIPVPAPEVPLVPTELPAPTGTQATGLGATGAIEPTQVGPATPVPEVLPSPETYVYVEELPAVVTEVKPIYPDLAREALVEGLVMVKVLVGKDGRVRDVRLAEEFQVPMLNEAALVAARQWVFTPGLAQGRPVACWLTIPFRFRLH